MGERLLEQSRILEAVADAVFETERVGAPALASFRGRRFGDRGRAAVRGGRTGRLAAGGLVGRFDGSRFAGSPATHRTIVNSRLQRTDHGQRHTIQACSPSRIEKKMIWARPTMFSNGT